MLTFSEFVFVTFGKLSCNSGDSSGTQGGLLQIPPSGNALDEKVLAITIFYDSSCHKHR